jgi:hypothetical protein
MPQDELIDCAGLRAAKRYLNLKARFDNPQRRKLSGPYTSKAPTIRGVAKSMGVSFNLVSKYLQKIKAMELGGEFESRPVGRPRRLTTAQDDALLTYAITLQRIGLGARPAMIQEAANRLLRRSDPTSKPLSRMWYRRWKMDHPELREAVYKPVEANRTAFEANISNIHTFFDCTEQAIQDLKIIPSGMWNMDECGCWLGCLGNRMKIVVVRTQKAVAVSFNLFSFLLYKYLSTNI